MAASGLVGPLGLLVCIIFWGSMNVSVRAAESRFPKVRVLMLFSTGIFISSLFCLVAAMSSASPFSSTLSSAFLSGAIGGAFWAPGQMLLVTAIMSGGLSLCQGACSGSVIISSYLLGVIVQKEPLKNPIAAVSGLAALVLGVAGLIGAKGKLSHRTTEAQERAPSSLMPLGKSLLAGILVALSGLMASFAEGKDTSSGDSTVVRACYFQVAFGCAQFLVHIAAIGSYLACTRVVGNHPMPLLAGLAAGDDEQTQCTDSGNKDGVLAIYVLLGGLMFTCAYVGNIFSIAYFGLSIGSPISQLSLVLSSAWGIVLFKEVQGSGRILLMLMSAVVMVLGALLLTMSKN